MPLFAAESTFLGKDSCASSGCHGGAGAHQNQSLVWARQDPHSQTPATLTTARSKRLAQLLKIDDPTRSARCTACHAPWQNLPSLPAGTSATSEAVSCETCHGPARDYLRSHTRTDLTRSQKRMDGLHDLTILYNRANTCVACHQVLDPALLEAGHPELLFELDGQSAAMPRHWRERETNTHAIAWLSGQAAALRELTAQLREKSSAQASLQWQSALWVINAALPNGPLTRFDTNAVASPAQLTELHVTSDTVSAQAGTLAQAPDSLIANLLRADKTRLNVHQAERLTLALDRLLYSSGGSRSPELQQTVSELFNLIQSRPDFDPEKFSQGLARLQLASRK